VDPQEVLDEDVENLLLHIADDFIEKTIISACSLAKHRKAHTIDVSDVQVAVASMIT
jgi:transcription initiation factor TFIID subunit TAF12